MKHFGPSLDCYKAFQGFFTTLVSYNFCLPTWEMLPKTVLFPAGQRCYVKNSLFICYNSFRVGKQQNGNPGQPPCSCNNCSTG